tara:strand:+ start:10828 stop:12165 length:1338 start_codon:yes stop_codon:yes gene_type:complete
MKMINNIFVLDALIDLYEALPSPLIANNGTQIKVVEPFELTLEQSTSICKLLDTCPSISKFITFSADYQELNIKDNEVDISLFIGKEIETIKVGFPQRQGSIPDIYFYQDEYELVNSHAQLLSKGGSLPESFYLTNSNFKPSNGDNEKLSKIARILEWFCLFKDISNVDTPKDNSYELVFIEKAGDDKLTKPVHFLTEICAEMLDVLDVPPLGHFEELRKINDRTDTNKKEKQKFLRVAFVEVLRELRSNGQAEGEALKVARNIENIRNSYYEHLELFMEDFAISEFKREIEDARFSYIEKIEAVIGDIQGKLYAIPAAFIAIGAIARSQTFESTILIVFGAFFASALTFIMVKNQEGRAQYVDKSIDFVFDKLERRNVDDTEHYSIIKNIDDAKVSLVKMLETKKKYIKFYLFAAWLPFGTALIVAFSRHTSEFCNWFLNTILL